MNIFFHKKSNYADYEFPWQADLLGITIAIFVTLPMPFYFIYYLGFSDEARKELRSVNGDWWLALKQLIKPHRHWGPRMKVQLKIKKLKKAGSDASMQSNDSKVC